jgi:histidinol dehydrogenase
MGVVPAVVAGVAEIVVCSPPGANGLPSTEVLAAAHLAGATRVFALGGAGAVAAMAFGTRTVPTVGSIVGPGNAWVTEAKRQVAGAVRIDSPAGPSELLILADRTADPELVAVELLAQAEHDTDAVVGLVTSSSELLASARTALEGLVVDAGRREIVTEALARRGFLLLARSLDDALAFAIDFAAEHLTVMTEDAETHADAVTTAGTVFLGGASSVAFGDYMTGANHVLPTGGLARTYSGLSVEHYLRSYTVQRISPPAAAALAGPVAALARAEGLPGHATAALARSPR